MAPEQISGEKPTPATDVYALGILLYEMLTGGWKPFMGRSGQSRDSTAERIRWEQVHLPAPSPRQYNPAISLELERIVMRCLEKNPLNRYADAAGLLSVLEPCLSVIALPSNENTAVRTPAPALDRMDVGGLEQARNQRQRMVWVGLLIGVPVIFLLLFLAVRGGGSGGSANNNYASPYLTSAPFYTPTPVWPVYYNSINGFSIEYPPGWVYQEDNNNPGTIDFASSSSWLTANDIPSSGAGLGVMRGKIADAFPQASQPYSPSALLNQFISQHRKDASEMQSVNSIYIDSLPAASGLYGISSQSGSTVVLDATLVLAGDYFYLTLGVAPQSEWQTYHPVLDRMTYSLKPGISSGP
jgi:serine/threonine protein kinase